MFAKYILPVCAAGLLAFAVWKVWGSPQPEVQVSPPAEPPRTPFRDTVAGSGIVEARTENIVVGSPVAGIVVEVYVQVDQEVRVSDPLFRLDDRKLLAELAIREAAVAAAQAEVNRLESQPRPEQVPVALAQVNRARADLADRQDRLTRVRPLVEQDVATQQDLVRAEQAVLQAKAELDRAQAELDLLRAGAWKCDLELALAAVRQVQAEAQETRTELERLTVRALVDGEVLFVNVRPGEFVAAPSENPLILLGDVTQLHARVDIDEHDIPRFRPGAAARAVVRGRSDEQLPLTFVRVEPFVVPKLSLTGANTERVDTRVLQVIYALDHPAKRLFVGQQLDVFIDASDETETAQRH